MTAKSHDTPEALTEGVYYEVVRGISTLSICCWALFIYTVPFLVPEFGGKADIMNTFDNLVPVYLVSNADRLAISEDNVLYMHMLRAKLESDIADMDMDFEKSESVQSVPSRKLSRKQRRAIRIEQNKQKKGCDRAHGKKRMPSAKLIREADKRGVYHAHAKFVWHENHKEEWIP